MSINRVRKEASKRLALELKKRYDRLVTAGGDQNEIAIAAVDLGTCFNDNIEFILFVLATYGGLTVPAPQPRKQKPVPGLPQTPKLFLNDEQDN